MAGQLLPQVLRLGVVTVRPGRHEQGVLHGLDPGDLRVPLLPPRIAVMADRGHYVNAVLI